MKGKIQTCKECFACRVLLGGYNPYGLEEHHIFFGAANRKLSEEYGLKVWLCPEHHRGTKGVHGRDGHELDEYLKKVGQLKFEETGSRDEFIRLFGKNYLG